MPNVFVEIQKSKVNIKMMKLAFLVAVSIVVLVSSPANGRPNDPVTNRNYNNGYNHNFEGNKHNKNFDDNNYGGNPNHGHFSTPNKGGSDYDGGNSNNRNSYPSNGRENPNRGGNTNHYSSTSDTGGGIPGINYQESSMESHARKKIDSSKIGGHIPSYEPHRPNNRRRLPSYPGLRPNGMPIQPGYGIPIPKGTDSNAEIDTKPAFIGCESHSNTHKSKMVDQHRETEKVHMMENSLMAIYPLTDNNDPMYLIINMPSVHFKAKIHGTNIDLVRCPPLSDECKVLENRSTKAKNLITPHEWNYIQAYLQQNELSIKIGANFRAITMTEFPEEDVENAEWFVSTSNGSSRSDGAYGGGGDEFLVQYPCAEYKEKNPVKTEYPVNTEYPEYTKYSEKTEYPVNPRTNGLWPSSSTPAGHLPHTTTTSYHYKPTEAAISYTTGESTDYMEGGNQTSSIVVGVVIAILLCIGIIAITVSLYRKRQSMQMTESTPLSEHKSKQKTDEQNDEHKTEEVRGQENEAQDRTE